MPTKTIECTFNILDNGRTYTGQQRNYVLDNVRNTLSLPHVQERLANKGAFGYFGHGIRRIAGMNPEEKTVVQTKNGGSMIVDAIPSNLCTAVDLDDQGNLTHVEEIMDNDEGKKALGLHNSKAGGFSWACNGGKKSSNTILNDFFGFDYVKNPLFTGNRGYVLDDASDEYQGLFDSLVQTGLSEQVATQTLLDFQADAIQEAEAYKEQLEAAVYGAVVLDGVQSELATTKQEVQAKISKINELEDTIAGERALRQSVLDSAASTFGVGGISDELKERVLDGCKEGFNELFDMMYKAKTEAAKFNHRAPKIDAPEVNPVLDDAAPPKRCGTLFARNSGFTF